MFPKCQGSQGIFLVSLKGSQGISWRKHRRVPGLGLLLGISPNSQEICFNFRRFGGVLVTGRLTTSPSSRGYRSFLGGPRTLLSSRLLPCPGAWLNLWKGSPVMGLLDSDGVLCASSWLCRFVLGPVFRSR